MVLCQGKEVDRNPAAIIIDKVVKEGNVERMWSILARFRVSRIILFPMFVVGSSESCMFIQNI